MGSFLPSGHLCGSPGPSSASTGASSLECCEALAPGPSGPLSCSLSNKPPTSCPGLRFCLLFQEGTLLGLPFFTPASRSGPEVGSGCCSQTHPCFKPQLPLFLQSRPPLQHVCRDTGPGEAWDGNWPCVSSVTVMMWGPDSFPPQAPASWGAHRWCINSYGVLKLSRDFLSVDCIKIW